MTRLGTWLERFTVFPLLIQIKSFQYCQAQPKPASQSQLGAEIALLSQLWGTTIHHTTPYTKNSSFEVLQNFR